MPATDNPVDLIQTGDANKLYIDTASDLTTPVWKEVILVDDVAVNDEPEAVDVPGRYADRVKRSMYGQKDGTLVLSVTKMKNDTLLAFLTNRKRLQKAVQVMVSDRDRTDEDAVTMIDWYMVQMPEKQPSKGDTTVEVTLTPTVVQDGSGNIVERKYSPEPA